VSPAVPRRRLSVFLVEPYYGGSHRAWADGYRMHSRHDVHLITHPAQFWKWRLQGGHVTLALTAGEHADRVGSPDVVLATSMLNLPAFLGAARRSVGDAAVVLYMHESQLSYPLSPLDKSDQTYPMINWSSVASADVVLFNSRYHRDVFFVELPSFLGRFPDQRHLGLVDDAMERSEVVAAGVDVSGIAPGPKLDPPLLLWNHRWDHDKGTAVLAEALTRLCERDLDFRVAICGEQFVSTPPEFEALPGLLGDRLIQFGLAPVDRYRELLAGSAIVLSTAHQEFFGIAVVEAMAAGAAPLLPNRLVYPERIPAGFEGACLYEERTLVDQLSALIMDAGLRRAAGDAAAETVEGFAWSVVAPRLDGILSELVEPVGAVAALEEADGAGL